MTLARRAGRLGKTPTGVDDAEARRVLVRFAEAGGTLLDSSNAYLGGHAEELLGDFLRDLGRDAFVVCTKYARPTDAGSPARRVGCHRGAMRDEVESSLRRLRTDRIDLYLAHLDDGLTPMEEIVRGLDDLSREGKIVHAGLSNFPAWRVATGAAIADARGMTPLVALQMQYHLGERSIEREHLALTQARGMTMMAWSPLGGGAAMKDPRLATFAAGRGLDPATVAIAWVLAKGVLPVLGARIAGHLDATLADLSLTPDEVALLDGSYDRGYPYALLDQVRASYGLPRRDVVWIALPRTRYQDSRTQITGVASSKITEREFRSTAHIHGNRRGASSALGIAQYPTGKTRIQGGAKRRARAPRRRRLHRGPRCSSLPMGLVSIEARRVAAGRDVEWRARRMGEEKAASGSLLSADA